MAYGQAADCRTATGAQKRGSVERDTYYLQKGEFGSDHCFGKEAMLSFGGEFGEEQGEIEGEKLGVVGWRKICRSSKL